MLAEGDGSGTPTQVDLTPRVSLLGKSTTPGVKFNCLRGGSTKMEPCLPTSVFFYDIRVPSFSDMLSQYIR